MVTASKNSDLFSEDKAKSLPWTTELPNILALEASQKQIIMNLHEQLTDGYEKSLERIRELQALKEKLKDKAVIVENAENMIRGSMDPIQCAKWTLFCEKHKFRPEIFFDPRMDDYSNEPSIVGRKRYHADFSK